MGLDIAGFGAVADLATGLIDRFFPNKTEQEKAQIAAMMAMMQGQLEINKAEAANSKVFVSGWRPFIGWVCGVAVAWNWVGLPLASFGAAWFGAKLDVSPANISEMMPVLMGMLGLGGLRTYEKLNGVASK